MSIIDDLQDSAACQQAADRFGILLEQAKADVALYEQIIKDIAEKLKTFAEETTAAVEETVEAVKEEVKKAAPKRTSKKAAKNEEAPVEEPVADDSAEQFYLNSKYQGRLVRPFYFKIIYCQQLIIA